MGSVFDWISISKAAEALQVSVRQVYKYIDKGQLTYLQEGKTRLVSRKDVKALLEAKKKGVPRAVNALLVLKLRAEVDILTKKVDLLMRLFDIRHEPLDLDQEDLVNLHEMANHHLKTPWSPHEEAMWCDVFVRLRLEDFEKIAEKGIDNPWRPFLSLAKIMLNHPYNPDNKLLLSAGQRNLEMIGFSWAHSLEMTPPTEMNRMIHADGVTERRMDRRLERIQQKLQAQKE